MRSLDTSAIYALVNRKDRDHLRVKKAFTADIGPYLVPAGILAEIAYLLEQRLGAVVLNAFIDDLVAGRFSLFCGEETMPRVGELVKRFADLPLGFSDAAVIACAEQHGGKVLTFDVRDFSVVAKHADIKIFPRPR